MSLFDIAVDYVFKHEGFYTKDHAGHTYYGITLPTLRRMAALDFYGMDWNKDGRIDELDMPGVTLEKAERIYKELWWDRYGYEQFVYPKVAIKTFDFAVNMGALQAHKLLQRSIVHCGGPEIAVDGHVGPQTLRAMREVGGFLSDALSEKAARFYFALSEQNRAKYGKYLTGWLRRAYDIP